MASKQNVLSVVMGRLTGGRVAIQPTLQDVDAALTSLADDVAALEAQEAQLTQRIAHAWGTPAVDELLRESGTLSTRKAAADKLRQELESAREGALYRHALASFENRCNALVAAQQAAAEARARREAIRAQLDEAIAAVHAAATLVDLHERLADVQGVTLAFGIPDSEQLQADLQAVMVRTGRRARPQQGE